MPRMARPGPRQWRFKDLSDIKKIELSRAIELLKAKGLADVSSESRVKHIADELDVTPVEVYELISK